MKVSHSGYYSWKSRGSQHFHRQENESLVPIIKEAHRLSRGSYGTRRMAEEIKASGIHCGRYKARTLMKLAGVTTKQKRKFKATTDSKHSLPVAPNLLKREFTTKKPDTVWVGDITYIWTSKGWLYWAVVIDLFSRKVVGWQMSDKIDRNLVIDALIMAIGRRNPVSCLIFHSDRGRQYCSTDFLKIIKKNKMLSSMSRKGDCWDNAVAESFFGSFKTERVFPYKYKTRDEARQDILYFLASAIVIIF